MHLIETLLSLYIVYLCIGLLFSVVFLLWGVTRVDPITGGAPKAFRLVILPGVVLLWPLMLIKWTQV